MRRQKLPHVKHIPEIRSAPVLKTRVAISRDQPYAMYRGQSDSSGKSVSLRPTVVLVDPFSTGAMLAPELEQRGMPWLMSWR